MKDNTTEIEIKAKPVDLRHKLSEVAKFYNVEEKRIVSKLAALADAEMIFQHDIERLKNGDYMLSGRALAMIFVNGQEHRLKAAALEDFARFLKITVGDDESGDSLTTDYIMVHTLAAQLNTNQQARKKGAMETMEDFMENVVPFDGLH